MKDSNQTPYDWEKDEGVFDQGSSAEQEDEVKLYRSAPQEEYEGEQEIQNQEELDEDYRSLLEQISAARSAKFYSAASIPEQEESEYSQIPQPKPERAEGFRLQIEEEEFDQPVAPESPADSEQPAVLEEPPSEIRETQSLKNQKTDETPSASGSHRKKKRFLLLKALLFAAVVIMISVYLSNVILGAAYDLFGLKKEDIDIEVDIPEGSSTQQIAEILKEKDVINEPMVFRIYSRLKKADGTYQYGTYTLNAKMSYDEIIRELQELVPRKDVVSITFPEGYTAVDRQNFWKKTACVLPAIFCRWCEPEIFPTTWSKISKLASIAIIVWKATCSRTPMSFIRASRLILWCVGSWITSRDIMTA